MGLTENFVAADDQQLMETFLAQGYIVREVANREGLDALRAEVV